MKSEIQESNATLKYLSEFDEFYVDFLAFD